jgi:DNA polymerase-3 subunit alpha (Gram-positive type)
LLVKKSNSEGYIVGSRGSVGSSVVAYLSGISEINPLAPHYICPKCQHHEFSDLASDGFDLPDRSCPHCQTAMNKNGHNIPFETFLGTPGAEKVPDIDLNFSGEYQARAHKFIVDMFGKENTYRAGTISTVADKKAYGFVKNYFELVRPGYEPSDAEIELLAQQLVGVKITTGQHPGGMIIVPKEYSILDFCPYNFPPQESGNSTDGSHAG